MKVNKLYESSLYDVEYDKVRLVGLKKDIKTLLKCNDVDDLNNASWEALKLDNVVNRRMKTTNQSFEDTVDEVVDSLFDNIRSIKTELLKKEEKLESGKKWISTLVNSLESNGYKVIRADEESLIVEGNGKTHDDCIAFADTVVSIINGRYHGTARGGSWSTWEVFSEDSVSFQVGWEGNVGRSDFSVKIS